MPPGPTQGSVSNTSWSQDYGSQLQIISSHGNGIESMLIVMVILLHGCPTPIMALTICIFLQLRSLLVLLYHSAYSGPLSGDAVERATVRYVGSSK